MYSKNIIDGVYVYVYRMRKASRRINGETQLEANKASIYTLSFLSQSRIRLIVSSCICVTIQPFAADR
jgi:hypothetical protein